MRSSARGVLAGLGLAIGCGGCHIVFGVDADARPCGDEPFSSAPIELDLPGGFEVETFSVSWDRDRIVWETAGSLYEQALPGGEAVVIDPTVYNALAVALAPEGDAMFVTAQIEPPVLMAAVRSAAAGWVRDAIVPPGTMAGSPSAAEFGPRRVLVRQRFGRPEVQEYEAVDNRWQPVGDVHPIGGKYGPNLTPSGLDMLYAADAGDGPAVFIAHRASTAEWFGAPVAILPGAYEFPVLLNRCRSLYALDTSAMHVVRQYAR